MASSCEKWFWIDLIGFDVERSDCAVPHVLDRAGFVPQVVSLLLHNAEFVHLHRGPQAEWDFPPDVCSYGGHESNEERQRQVWRPNSLHRLVQTLQTHGTRVFFSVFDSGIPAGWRQHHPELGYVCSDGVRSPRICPWKRLADGTYYEDFFVTQLREVMRDYGFDGFHGADGYSHPRFPLHTADFSDDMIGQFREATGETLPDAVGATCDADPEAIGRRAEWIWTERRQAWIEFHTQRTARFWRKVLGMLHAEDKQLLLNTCWTRDPFEAGYRFGVDYQALAKAGADAFIVEAAGAVQELGGDLPYGTAYGQSWTEWDPSRILCRFQTTILHIKAAVPDAKLVFLNGIKDTNEIWNGLRHAPTNIESEIGMHGNVFIRGRDGELTRCAAGPVVCLADGIRPEEWQWLNEVWDRAYEWPARGVPGATVVWSDTAAERHLGQYLSTRQCPTGRLLFELVARGAPLYTIQRVDDLRVTADPLLVLHPQLWTDKELDTVFACAHGPLLLIGERLPGRKPAAEWAESPAGNGLWCGLYGLADDGFRSPVPEADEEEGAVVGALSATEPPSWIYELPMQPVSGAFLSACARTVTEISGAPRVVENAESVRVWAVEGPGGVLRLFLRNDAFYYRVAKVDMRREIRAMHVRTRFPGKPIAFSGACFHVKIPGKGMVIADVELLALAP